MEPNLRASYTDSFEHAFDEKGRITIPSEWRGEPFESRLFIFPSQDACIKVYPESWLTRLQVGAQKLGLRDPQRLQVEALAGLAQAVAFDQQGRIGIKERFRAQAGIKKEAVLVGSLDHFKIYHPDTLRALPRQATTLEEAAAALGL